MTIVPTFRKAQRIKCKASILIEGLSGKGKSGLALSLAYALTKDWDKIAAVDTENRSLPLYVGSNLHTGIVVEEFNVGDLTADDGFKPSHYAAFRDLAIGMGMEALVCDSISHMWQYKGGVLDMVTQLQSDNPRLNKYNAWGEPQIVAEKNMIMSLIRHPKLHCINTVRVKEKMEFIADESGKMGLRSLGEQQIVMPDLKYEPDLVLSMLEPGDKDGTVPKVKVSKSRYAPFRVGENYGMTANLMEQLRLFLEEGTNPNELLEMQRNDYIEAITEYLDANPSARTIWELIKENAGLKGMPLKEIPLSTMKILFAQLVA